jgi:hypothetical protein
MTAKRLFLYLVIAVFSLAFASAGLSAGEEVSGTVTKDDLIVVQKGKAKWEISRGKDTKVTGIHSYAVWRGLAGPDGILLVEGLTLTSAG